MQTRDERLDPSALLFEGGAGGEVEVNREGGEHNFRGAGCHPALRLGAGREVEVNGEGGEHQRSRYAPPRVEISRMRTINLSSSMA